MASIDVTVDIDPWDVIDELDEEQIAEHLRDCGWQVSKTPSALEELDREDLDYLIEKLGDASDWQGRRTMDKIRNLRFG